MNPIMRTITLLFICFLAFFSLLTMPIYAALTPTPTSTPAPTSEPTAEPGSLNEKVKLLKEKIETKVAEIAKNDKQIIRGTIKEARIEELDVIQSDQKVRKVLLESGVTVIKDFVRTEMKPLAIKELTKDDVVIVAGFPLESDFSAKVIYRIPKMIFVSGQITDLSKDFVITLIGDDKKEVSIDIESSTTQNLLDSKNIIYKKTGFSKIKVGDRIQAVVLEGASGKNKKALRIAIIPQEYFASQ
ncbi:MAG: hypothetical protein UZ21_OP11001000092 [Microgenomates bacterium OLB22]|nr:MAG: hypothetical protein UZ21_OP11001000092 [Microgenomates bacterium OLB22]